MGKDQRVTQRAKVQRPVRLQFAGADDFLQSYCENISVGGLFVATRTVLDIGTEVTLQIEVQPGKGFQAIASVVRQSRNDDGTPRGLGLKFVGLTDQVRGWLDDALNKHNEAKAEKAKEVEAVEVGQSADSSESDEQDFSFDLGEDSDFDAPGPVRTDEIKFAPGEAPILAIDLGTSNSCACVYYQGFPIVLELEEGAGSRTIPSVVSWDASGRVSVGRAAQDRLADDPKRTVFGSKRFIGRMYDHPDVQRMLSHYPYKVVPGAGGKVAAEIDGRVVPLTEIAAKILAHIKEKAEATLRLPMNQAIITVPAYYNQNQRNAVIQAGRLAGLDVLRTVDEPTAAAVPNGLTYTSPTRVLVYDLGGGTFDVSVLAMSDRSVVVLATEGDTFLGGEDFDAAIVQHIGEKFKEKTGKALSQNHAALAIVRQASEAAKRRLGVHEKTMVMVREAVLLGGETARLEVEITREEIEYKIAPFVDRTLQLCDQALAAARIKLDDLGDVILVGGQTHMPYVQRRVQEHFGREPCTEVPPDEAVALGAGMLTQIHETGHIDLQDVLSLSIGIDNTIDGGDGTFMRLLERNSTLPSSVSYRVEIPRKALNDTNIGVYQGEADELRKNEFLGNVPLGSITAGTADPVALELEFALSMSCLLSVTVTDLETKQTEDVLLDTSE